MSADIYSRGVDDTKKDINETLELSDPESLLIIQIENIFFTKKREVIGQENFGLNLEDLLFSFNSNEGDIKSKIVSQIRSFCPLSQMYPIDVKVRFVKGSERDMGVIDMYISNKKALTYLL